MTTTTLCTTSTSTNATSTPAAQKDAVSLLKQQVFCLGKGASELLCKPEVANALSQSPFFGNSKMRNEISQLQLSSSVKAIRKEQQFSKKTNKVKAFFDRFGVSEGQFSRQDLQEFYRMMSTHPISRHISFYALFGLEFCALLEEVNGLEKSLPKDIPHICAQQWRNKYMDCYRALFMQKEGPIPLFVNKNGIRINTIETYYSQIKESFQQELAEKTRAVLSKPIKAGTQKSIIALYQKQYDRDVVPFLEKWNTTSQLFQKCLLSEQSYTLLYNSHLHKCLGIHEVMPFSSPADVRTAGKILCKYITFIQQCIADFTPAVAPQVLELFANLQLNPQIFDETSSDEAITVECKQLYSRVVDCLDRLTQFQEKETNFFQKQGALNCCISYLTDISNALHLTIIASTDPLYETKRLHEMRLLANLGFLALDMAGAIKTDETLCIADYPPGMGSIYFPFRERLQLSFFSSYEEELKRPPGKDLHTDSRNILETLEKCLKQKMLLHYFMRDELEQMTFCLKRLAMDTLDQLSQYVAAHPQEMQQFPILEGTLHLARVLVLVHDLDVVLRGQSEWDYELPSQYLDLPLEGIEQFSDSSDEVETPTVAVHLPVNNVCDAERPPPQLSPSEDTCQATGEAILALLEPNTLSHENKEERVRVTPPRRSLLLRNRGGSSVPQKPLSAVKNVGLKKGMRARRAVAVLERLGLTAVAGGRHTRMEDGKGHLVTVVPRHGDLDDELFGKIQKQVEQHMPLPPAMLPRKPRR